MPQVPRMWPREELVGPTATINGIFQFYQFVRKVIEIWDGRAERSHLRPLNYRYIGFDFSPRLACFTKITQCRMSITNMAAPKEPLTLERGKFHTKVYIVLCIYITALYRDIFAADYVRIVCCVLQMYSALSNC